MEYDFVFYRSDVLGTAILMVFFDRSIKKKIQSIDSGTRELTVPIQLYVYEKWTRRISEILLFDADTCIMDPDIGNPFFPACEGHALVERGGVDARVVERQTVEKEGVARTGAHMPVQIIEIRLTPLKIIGEIHDERPFARSAEIFHLLYAVGFLIITLVVVLSVMTTGTVPDDLARFQDIIFVVGGLEFGDGEHAFVDGPESGGIGGVEPARLTLADGSVLFVIFNLGGIETDTIALLDEESHLLGREERGEETGGMIRLVGIAETVLERWRCGGESFGSGRVQQECQQKEK